MSVLLGAVRSEQKVHERNKPMCFEKEHLLSPFTDKVSQRERDPRVKTAKF